MAELEIYAVAEEIGDPLRASCVATGCGLLVLTSNNELNVEVEYERPNRDDDLREFEKRLRQVRRKLDTKLNANLESLQEQFSERKKVTAGMKEATRAGYLQSIEDMMVRWREWGDERSAELDALAGSGDDEALRHVEHLIELGVE